MTKDEITIGKKVKVTRNTGMLAEGARGTIAEDKTTGGPFFHYKDPGRVMLNISSGGGLFAELDALVLDA